MNYENFRQLAEQGSLTRRKIKVVLYQIKRKNRLIDKVKNEIECLNDLLTIDCFQKALNDKTLS